MDALQARREDVGGRGQIGMGEHNTMLSEAHHALTSDEMIDLRTRVNLLNVAKDKPKEEDLYDCRCYAGAIRLR